jgi:hypothetical protein
MQREEGLRALNWCEKTMSVLREKQLEACEKRLSSHPKAGLFSGCTLLDIQHLWDLSFYGMENPELARLHEVGEVEELVLQRLPREVSLVSVGEHMLLERLLTFQGETDLLDWDEAGAAEALVARMWCTLAVEDDRLVLRLPEALHVPMLEAMNREEHAQIRDKLFRFDATMHSLLYIAGFLHAQQPTLHFLQEVCPAMAAEYYDYAQRYLRATFDYTTDVQGEMILVHPGLADPEHLMRQVKGSGIAALELSETMMLGGMNGIFPEEVAISQEMAGALQGALRPEYTPEDAVEDLRMLAKQGVPLPEMESVLSSMLWVLPTPAMGAALVRLAEQTPRWGGLQAALRH